MRRRFSRAVQATVLLQSKRRCAFCFGLRGDVSEKRGQIAPVEAPEDSRLENAAWLCGPHHDRYDSPPRQTKGYTPAELREYRAQLYEFLQDGSAWPAIVRPVKTAGGHKVGLAAFDRRIPTYRATREFLRHVCQVDDLDLQKLLQFARDTDEALFLFDDRVAEYLAELFKKALRLRAISLTLRAPDNREPDVIEEQSELALWFTKQFEESRKVFAPYLRIGDAG